MIYVEINNCYINVNHIILIRSHDSNYSANGDAYSKIIYGFSNGREVLTVQGTPKEIIESIRKQIKEQICRIPELMGKVEDRFRLMDFEE